MERNLENLSDESKEDDNANEENKLDKNLNKHKGQKFAELNDIEKKEFLQSLNITKINGYQQNHKRCFEICFNEKNGVGDKERKRKRRNLG